MTSSGDDRAITDGAGIATTSPRESSRANGSRPRRSTVIRRLPAVISRTAVGAAATGRPSSPEPVKRAVELDRGYLSQVKTGGRIGDAANNLAEMERALDKL